MGSLFSISVKFDDKELKRKARRFPELVNKALSASVEYNAPYATAYMKTHAPWHDDTGAARASLIAVANNHGTSHELLLAHGVHYGIWLEVAHNRRYEILQTTMRIMGPKIMSDAGKFLEAMAKR